MSDPPSASWPPLEEGRPGPQGGYGWSPPRSTCYAHPGRAAGSVCRRCGRPICPDCMREAPVGWQCASCVKEGSRTSPVIRWRPGSVGGFSRRVTPMVVLLVAVNVVAYLWETRHPAFEYKYALEPAQVHYAHKWYQLITSTFLHLSFTHIFLNMLTLIIVGPVIEAAVGWLRFAAIYLLSGLGGSIAFYLLAPSTTYALGASGAIFGLMGAWFVLARRHRWPLQPVTGLLVINIVYSFVVPGIAWQAHLGGMVIGAVAAFGMDYAPRPRLSPVAVAVQALAVTVVLGAVLAVLAQLPPGHVNFGT